MTSTFDAAFPRGSVLRLATDALGRHGIDTARNDARLLCLHALGLSHSDLILHGCEAIGVAGAASLERVVTRRVAGEPVARILGTWEFWSLPFALTPATLVPRPDTETLVERALVLVGGRNRPLTILDLGTGSGCVLVALLSELPSAYGIGTDRSFAALSTARQNAVANRVGARASFALGDWCAAPRGPFDLIVSNPPYIASATIPGLAVEVRAHDPLAALDGGPDGLSAYRAIIAEIAARPGLLTSDGALVLEVGYDQAEAVRQVGAEAGFSWSRVDRDLAGQARVVTLRPPFAATSSSQKSIGD